MRIVQQSPTQLMAHNSPFGSRLGSSLLVMLGASIFAVPTSLANEHLNVQVYAYVFISLGVVALLISGRFITWMFDKSDDSLLIQSQILFITKKSKYALKEIDKVQIESEMTGEDGTLSFGIELLLIGGERLHLCPSFNLSEFTAKDGVRRISSFLDL
jgi:hypothetical protein